MRLRSCYHLNASARGRASRTSLKTRERLETTRAGGGHGSKIIFGRWIADERCCCRLRSHSRAQYIPASNPSSPLCPHPRLLPLPPFSRRRHGPQVQPQPGAAAPRVAAATAAGTPRRWTQARASAPGSPALSSLGGPSAGAR